MPTIFCPGASTSKGFSPERQKRFQVEKVTRSGTSIVLSFIGSVAIFAVVGALLWGVGHWFVYDTLQDAHRWDLDAMSTDTKDALVARCKAGALGGGVLGAIAFLLASGSRT